MKVKRQRVLVKFKFSVPNEYGRLGVTMSVALIGASSELITGSRGDCGSHRFVIHMWSSPTCARP